MTLRASHMHRQRAAGHDVAGHIVVDPTRACQDRQAPCKSCAPTVFMMLTHRIRTDKTVRRVGVRVLLPLYTPPPGTGSSRHSAGGHRHAAHAGLRTAPHCGVPRRTLRPLPPVGGGGPGYLPVSGRGRLPPPRGPPACVSPGGEGGPDGGEDWLKSQPGQPCLRRVQPGTTSRMAGHSSPAGALCAHLNGWVGRLKYRRDC